MTRSFFMMSACSFDIAAAREMNLIQRDVNTGDLTNRVKYIWLLLSQRLVANGNMDELNL